MSLLKKRKKGAEKAPEQKKEKKERKRQKGTLELTVDGDLFKVVLRFSELS